MLYFGEFVNIFNEKINIFYGLKRLNFQGKYDIIDKIHKKQVDFLWRPYKLKLCGNKSEIVYSETLSLGPSK